jgi:diguanylate cyclase (GGDEF)-like protein/putative nucleotidyltransferase with HDIG domain
MSIETSEPQTPAKPQAVLPSHTEPDHPGSAVWIARFAWFIAIVSALGALALFHISGSHATVLVAAQIPGIIALGVLVDILMRKSHSRIHNEREKALSAWLSKQSELEEIATRDDLTQLQNRRFFYQRFHEEMDRAGATRRNLSIAMIDVDDLKLLNDEFGHQVGDIVLRQFARILNRQASEGMVTARLGGDEFAVIMPETDRRAAEQFSWKLWDELAKAPIYESEHASIYLGVSIGIGGYPWGGGDLEEVIHWADTKLYANKLERKGFKKIQDAKADNRLASAVVEVLSTALDVRDRMTHRHARRVARMAVLVARELELSDDEVLEIEFAAALHDIGKIGVTDNILRKAAPLDDEEWKEMRKHSELGYQILRGVDFLKNAAEIVYAHHERYDGTGYPRGLAGEEIPLGSRLFSIVDAFDAMTSRRPYRAASSRQDACEEIARNAGTQFDPFLVDAFLKTIRRTSEEEYTDWRESGSRIESLGPHDHARSPHHEHNAVH